MPDVSPSPRILVVQNDADKPAGRVGDALLADGAALDARMSSGMLPDVAAYDGLVVLPGLADPQDHDPTIDRARQAIEQALERTMPVLGICLGGQLLAQVLGGRTYQCRPELGYREVMSTAAARTDPLLGRAPERFAAFHAHAYAFEPPPGATVLLANDVCVQACQLEESWAIQCHPEATVEWVDAVARGIRGQTDRIDPRTPEFFRSHGIDPAVLEADAREAAPTAHRVAQGIGRGFAGRCRAYSGGRSIVRDTSAASTSPPPNAA
jgi:GMP synthase-like glutamine amidotransferase